MTDFIQARGFTRGRIAAVDLLMIHTAEGPRRVVDLGGFFHRTTTGSSHSGVDDHGRLDFVRFDDTAWGCPGCNADGEHLELCGFAHWTRAEWLDHPGMLEQTARWLAHRCEARRIPAVYLGPAQLRADRRGITTHRSGSAAFHLSDHTDPGDHFPMDHVLDRVHQLLDGVDHRPRATTARPPFRGLLELGSHGKAVLVWQRRLSRRWNYRLGRPDGAFGPRTDRATRLFQRDHDLRPDGLVGRKTWAAAWPGR